MNMFGEVADFAPDDLGDALAEYARRVESGEVIPPLEFSDRCAGLRVLGLEESIVRRVWESGSARILRQMEALTPGQVVALNDAAMRVG